MAVTIEMQDMTKASIQKVRELLDSIEKEAFITGASFTMDLNSVSGTPPALSPECVYTLVITAVSK